MNHFTFRSAPLMAASLLAVVSCGMMFWPQSAMAKPAPAPAPDAKAIDAGLAMPSEVRDMMAPGATTIHFARLPFGENGAPVLLHVWKIERRSTEDFKVPSPACMDLFFKPAWDPDQWRLASSICLPMYNHYYPGEDTYTAYWLDSKTKQGVVIVERYPYSTEATIRLITLPKGLGAEISMDSHFFVQRFSESLAGGGSVSRITYDQDANGQMIVKKQIKSKTAAPSYTETYAWNGEKWAMVSSRKDTQK